MILYALLFTVLFERKSRRSDGEMHPHVPFVGFVAPILPPGPCGFCGKLKKAHASRSRNEFFLRTPVMRGLAGVISLLFFLMAPLPSRAEEKILSFSSAATVHEDSSLEVREDIAVNVEGRRIQRGIYRDFPTKYRDSTGRAVAIGFSVKSALLGGREVPYSVRSIADGVRIYLGDPNRRAPPGRQTYTLVYVVTGALGFFDEHDELYWNVTGNDWAFAIDEARFSLSLPGGARPTALEFFTGWRGARGQDAQQLPDGSVVTTEPLPPGEGLTVVYAWPKGLASPPEEPFLRTFFSRYHAHFLVALPLLLLFVYLLLWLRWGKDPPMPVIIPLFSPSRDRTPGFLRYVSRMGMAPHISFRPVREGVL